MSAVATVMLQILLVFTVCGVIASIALDALKARHQRIMDSGRLVPLLCASGRLWKP